MIRIIRKLLKMDPDFPHLRPELVDFHAPNEVKFNKELCKACKGLCCQRFGCFFSPRDFKKITFKDLYPEIEKGYIQIVYIPKSSSGQGTGVFVLAMRNQHGPVVNIPLRYTGPCMMLTDEGCKLSRHERPYGGIFLIPKGGVDKKTGKAFPQCEAMYTACEASFEWLPYKAVLKNLAHAFCDDDSGVPDK